VTSTATIGVVDDVPWVTSSSPRAAFSYCASIVAEVASTPTVSDLVAKGLTRQLVVHFAIPDLLSAYAQLHAACHERKTRLALHQLINLTPWNTHLAETIRLLSTMNQDEALTVILEVVGSALIVPTDMLYGDELGLLTRVLFKALVDPGRCSRRHYLLRRLGSRALTRPQMDLAGTLCGEWAGTLDSLEETIHTLAPIPDQVLPGPAREQARRALTTRL
jgi:hypothetical protein